MRTAQWIWLPAACLPVAAISIPAYAATYLTVEQAQQTIFPGEKLAPANIMLTNEQAREIERRSDANVRRKNIKLWKVANGSYFIVDEVVGKHEFITYAVGLNADGYEVRNADWRAQFVGKNAAAPLKLNKDIKNISGATLSCRHIADGVKRILATYEIALK